MVDYPSLSRTVILARLRDGLAGPRRWLFVMMAIGYTILMIGGCSGLWSLWFEKTAYPTPFSSVGTAIAFTLVTVPLGLWWALNNFRSEAERDTHRERAIEEDAARIEVVIANNTTTFSADDCVRLAHAIARALPLKRE